MKHIFGVLAITYLCFACKDPVPELGLGPKFWGEASVQKNGQLWTGHPGCFIDIIDKHTLVLQLDSFAAGNYLREGIFFAELSTEVGVIQILKNNNNGIRDSLPDAYMNFFSGDESLGDYQVLETDSLNRFILDSYDTLSKEIKGRFDLTLIVRKRPYPNTPDTIRFRDGQFHGRLHKI